MDKPQKSVEQFLSKITPMLETITKSIKSGTSDNISENMSSVSKGEKSISPHFRNVNKEFMDKMQALKQASSQSLKEGDDTQSNLNLPKGRMGETDTTVRIRELISLGKLSGVFE